jgi:hypothetical protein
MNQSLDFTFHDLELNRPHGGSGVALLSRQRDLLQHSPLIHHQRFKQKKGFNQIDIKTHPQREQFQFHILQV